MNTTKDDKDTRRILVIDDSAIARRLARSTFEQEGYEVTEAENGSTGLELIRSQAPDCVVLDLLMPEMTGQDLLQEIRREELDVPVIVITADVQTTTQKECLELGAAAVLHKPRDAEELVNAVRSVFGQGEESV